jgi:MFS family permease
MREAAGAARFVARLGEDGKENGSEDRDYRDHNKKLDQGKATASIHVALHRSSEAPRCDAINDRSLRAGSENPSSRQEPRAPRGEREAVTVRTEAIHTETPPHFWWNFIVLQVDVSTFLLGLAFLDSATVLPLLLTRLGATSTAIGAVQAVQTLGMMLPPLFAAHWIHGRRRHQGFLVAVCGIGRVGLLTLLAALLLWGKTRPGLVLAWFFVVYALFWATDGACQVSWLDIIAKTIPARARGRLFGTMQVLGGLLAAGAGLVVLAVLRPGRFAFPMEFALLLALWCAGAAVSQVALMLLREPDGAAAPEKPALWAHLAQAPGFLRRHRRVAQIIGIRFLLNGGTLAFPFYILFAREHLGVSDATAGLYLTVQKVGEIATGALWGYLSDRFGPAIGLRAVAAAVVGAPLLGAVGAPPLPSSRSSSSRWEERGAASGCSPTALCWRPSPTTSARSPSAWPASRRRRLPSTPWRAAPCCAPGSPTPRCSC